MLCSLRMTDRPKAERNQAVDLLRGVAMVIMALDHVRDFFGMGGGDPTNPATTTPWLFFTRWVTHLCAPTFVFLAGTAAYLSSTRKSTQEVSGFLMKRGFWLVLLEVTVVRLGWTFSLSGIWFQVMWALGVSMIALAGLVWLPTRVIATVSIALVAGHNTLDNFHVTEPGIGRVLWSILHEPHVFHPTPNMKVGMFYPVLPWIGLMSLGWLFGRQVTKPQDARRRFATRLGLALIVGFVALRLTNLYGDPRAWSPQATVAGTIMSFLQLQKYPPSLLFLAATMGIGLLLLGGLDRKPVAESHPLLVFGRVPLFYYVAHLYVIHLLAIVVASWQRGEVLLTYSAFRSSIGWPLWAVYAIWVVVVVALYFPSRWFARLKARRRDWWLSYL